MHILIEAARNQHAVLLAKELSRGGRCWVARGEGCGGGGDILRCILPLFPNINERKSQVTYSTIALALLKMELGGHLQCGFHNIIIGMGRKRMGGCEARDF